jgi:hypothetical protein
LDMQMSKQPMISGYVWTINFLIKIVSLFKGKTLLIDPYTLYILREPRGIEMGPRASSDWRGVRRLNGMYKFTINPSFGWDVNKTEVPVVLRDCHPLRTLKNPV